MCVIIGALLIIGDALTNITKVPSTIAIVVLLIHGGQIQYNNAAKPNDQIALNSFVDRNFFIVVKLNYLKYNDYSEVKSILVFFNLLWYLVIKVVCLICLTCPNAVCYFYSNKCTVDIICSDNKTIE